jgi:hypothetical protein
MNRIRILKTVRDDANSHVASPASHAIRMSTLALASCAARAIILLVALASPLHGADRYLVQRGTALAQIVIAREPTRSQKLAAEELRLHVKTMTGAVLPIVTEPDGKFVSIFVGESPSTARLGIVTKGLEDGAFRLVSGDSWFALVGDDADFIPHELYARTVDDRARVRGEFEKRTQSRWDLPIDNMDRRRHAETGWWQDDKRGSLHAVHEFLRGLGMRWFMPGALGEVAPKLDSIALPDVNRTVKPDFALRQMDCNRWDQVSKEEILWHLRLGLNWGGDYLGHGRRHGIQAVLAREDMKRQHPEYYALWGGKRQTDYLGDGAPCLSAEGLLQEHVRYVRAMFDLFDEPVVDIALPDNLGKTGRTCECELCVPQYNRNRPFGSLSDYAWRYMSRVAEEVAKSHPHKKLVAYAYQSTFLPPEKIAKLPPNLVVILANGSRAERLFPERLPAGKRDVDAIRSAWAEKVTSGVLYNWEYYLFSRPAAGGLHGVPVFFPHGIEEDMRALKATPGMRGEFLEVTRNDQTRLPGGGPPSGKRGELYAPAFNHLNVYLTSRFYWDVNLDVNVLLADYCEKFYGPAARQMLACIEFGERNWTRMTSGSADAAICRQWERLLNSARQAAPAGSSWRARIELLAEYVVPAAK